MQDDNIRGFDSISDITPADVEWLKEGVDKDTRSNDRTIYYVTSRGVTKGILFRGGLYPRFVVWGLSGTSDKLTDEEAKVFDPETYAERMARKQARKQARKEAIESGENLKVGDILGGSYGYDATLWEFYEVVKVSESGKTVWVRELAQETAEGYNSLSWKCRPIPGRFVGDAEKHAVQYYVCGGSASPYLKISDCVWAHPLDDVSRWHDADDYH